MPAEPTVFIVDDDRGVRNSIRELVLSVRLQAETFDSAQAFLDRYDPVRPGCLVLDVRMARMSGIALQERLAEMGAQIPIVFVSGHGDIAMAVGAIKRGAVDFVRKPYHEQQLLDAINEALARDAACRGRSADPAGESALAARIEALTPREREILERALSGMTSKAIATELGISYRTVELHRSHVLEKLGAASIAALSQQVARLRN
ncbi:MAG: response regulator [Burkholderiales bacterium]